MTKERGAEPLCQLLAGRIQLAVGADMMMLHSMYHKAEHREFKSSNNAHDVN